MPFSAAVTAAKQQLGNKINNVDTATGKTFGAEIDDLIQAFNAGEIDGTTAAAKLNALVAAATKQAAATTTEPDDGTSVDPDYTQAQHNADAPKLSSAVTAAKAKLGDKLTVTDPVTGKTYGAEIDDLIQAFNAKKITGPDAEAQLEKIVTAATKQAGATTTKPDDGTSVDPDYTQAQHNADAPKLSSAVTAAKAKLGDKLTVTDPVTGKTYGAEIDDLIQAFNAKKITGPDAEAQLEKILAAATATEASTATGSDTSTGTDTSAPTTTPDDDLDDASVAEQIAAAKQAMGGLGNQKDPASGRTYYGDLDYLKAQLSEGKLTDAQAQKALNKILNQAYVQDDITTVKKAFAQAGIGNDKDTVTGRSFYGDLDNLKAQASAGNLTPEEAEIQLSAIVDNAKAVSSKVASLLADFKAEVKAGTTGTADPAKVATTTTKAKAGEKFASFMSAIKSILKQFTAGR